MASSKLTAKAARLDFSSLPGAAAPVHADPLSRPKTAPGAMMAFANDARSELMRENDELRQKAAQADAVRGRLDEALGDLRQWDGAKATRLIDAALIAPSRFANRHELNYVGPDFAALRAEIESAGGNVQPIKVRSIAAVAAPGEGGAQFEVVFGHRRHRACLELGLPVLAVVDNLDDRTLFVEMDRENRARKDLSAWEQGMMYRRALQLGLFPSNRKLSEAIGVDLSALGKALLLADLPEEIVRAFPSPLALQFRWAKPLGQALAHQPDAVRAAARQLAAGPVDRSPRAVLAQLLAAAGQGGGTVPPLPEPITILLEGLPAAVLSMGAQGQVNLTVQAGVVPEKRLPALAKLIEGFLTGLPRGA